MKCSDSCVPVASVHVLYMYWHWKQNSWVHSNQCLVVSFCQPSFFERTLRTKQSLRVATLACNKNVSSSSIWRWSRKGTVIIHLRWFSTLACCVCLRISSMWNWKIFSSSFISHIHSQFNQILCQSSHLLSQFFGCSCRSWPNSIPSTTSKDL